jgi:hypothetical protein
MKSTAQQLRTEANWPPEEGEVISFRSSTGPETAILREVRWGLVWRDFILEDGRVIPEHRLSDCPQPQPWRNISEVTEDEPRQRDQPFWAELNQYLAYTYLRYKPGRVPDIPPDAERPRTHPE